MSLHYSVTLSADLTTAAVYGQRRLKLKGVLCLPALVAYIFNQIQITLRNP